MRLNESGPTPEEVARIKEIAAEKLVYHVLSGIDDVIDEMEFCDDPDRLDRLDRKHSELVAAYREAFVDWVAEYEANKERWV